jgi:hypothetical protein
MRLLLPYPKLHAHDDAWKHLFPPPSIMLSEWASRICHVAYLSYRLQRFAKELKPLGKLSAISGQPSARTKSRSLKAES